jgi:hypothetical protein
MCCCRTLLLSAAIVCMPVAMAAPRLTEPTYVDIGDTVVEMLNTSGLALSSLATDRARAPGTEGLRPSFSPAAHAKTFDRPCPGGGRISGSITDRDGSGDLSEADRFVTVFAECRLDGEPVSGRSEFTVTRCRLEGTIETTELEFQFKDLGTASMRWSGPASLMLTTDRASGSEHVVVTYRHTAVTRGSATSFWNFQLDVQRPPVELYTVRIGGEMALADGTVLRLVQEEPFVLAPGGTPRSGTLKVTDAAGARLRVEAGLRRYHYRLYLNENTGEAPDSSSFSRPYEWPWQPRPK